MRTGENNRDLTAVEKKAGQKAAKNIKAVLRSTLTPFRQSGAMLSGLAVKPIMKFGGVDNITIFATNVTFIHHHGFEKSATNKAKYTLKPRGYFTDALNKTNALETLADEIGSARAEEITAKINW